MDGSAIATIDIVSSPPNETAMREYDSLKAEIGRHEEQIFQAFTYSLGGSVAIVSWGLSERSWAVLLLVPFILLPAGFLILARVGMEKRIGAYVQYFYERRSQELNWETALSIMAGRPGLKNPEGALVIALGLPLFTVGISSVVAAWMIGMGTRSALPWLWAGTLIDVVLAVIIALIMRRLMSRSLTDEYLSQLQGQIDAIKRHDGSSSA